MLYLCLSNFPSVWYRRVEKLRSTLLFNRCKQQQQQTNKQTTTTTNNNRTRILLDASFSEHHAINTAHLSYSNSTGSQFLKESNTKMLACVITTQSQGLSYPRFLSYCTFTFLSRSLRSSSDTRMFKLHRFNVKHSWVYRFLILRSPRSEQLRHQALSYFLFLQRKNSRYFSSPNVLV